MVNEIFDYQTQTVLWSCADYARSNLEMFKGIMFKKKEGIQSGNGFVCPLIFDFKKTGRLSNAIHSLFCVEFDAVFLDEDLLVVDVYPFVQPWQLFITSRQPFRYLIETPKGQTVGRVGVGQRLWFNVKEFERVYVG